MSRQFLTIPVASAITERVFSFAGLTLSDLRKSLLEGTLDAIMWSKWGSPSIPLGKGDLHITHPEHCDYLRLIVLVSEFQNCSVLSFLMRQ